MIWHPGQDKPCLRSYPDDVPCGGRCLGSGIWTTAARVAALGTDGTSGLGRMSLIAAIRAYRTWPNRDLWHPSPGSSHAGLSAARGHLGVAGVLAAIAACGCHEVGAPGDPCRWDRPPISMWKNDSNPCT
jgi:hypothetical protein